MGHATQNHDNIAYVVTLPGGIFAAVALSGIAIETVNAMPRSVRLSEVVGFAINIVPALFSGVFVYGLTALWLRCHGCFREGFVSRVRRTTALYVVAVLCGVVAVRAWNSPDSGLWGTRPDGERCRRTSPRLLREEHRRFFCEVPPLAQRLHFTPQPPQLWLRRLARAGVHHHAPIRLGATPYW